MPHLHKRVNSRSKAIAQHCRKAGLRAAGGGPAGTCLGSVPSGGSSSAVDVFLRRWQACAPLASAPVLAGRRTSSGSVWATASSFARRELAQASRGGRESAPAALSPIAAAFPASFPVTNSSINQGVKQPVTAVLQLRVSQMGPARRTISAAWRSRRPPCKVGACLPAALLGMAAQAETC